MAEEMSNGGGIMIVTAPVAVQQIVYLDFDGELTSYNGEILTIDHVVVEDSGLNTTQISAIADQLNEDFADRGVIFVTERPAEGDFSTIYIGKTSSFEEYGTFAGLAETIDAGNLNQSDNAFVILSGNESATAIADTIAHEVEHIVFGMTHAGSGLAAYAAHTIIGNGVTSTGLTITSGNSVTVSSGGVANSTTVNSGGGMCISSGGVANNTTVNSFGYLRISSGGVANETVLSGGGYYAATMHISNGGVANYTTVNSRGSMTISSGGVANSTTVNSGGRMFISSGGTATDIIWTPCVGYVSAEDGAYVTYVSQYSGVYFGSANQLLSSAATMDNKIVSGSMYVMSDGTANSTTVSFGGDLFISSGGTANSTTVNSSGYLFIESGGVANSTTVNSGGWMYISSGGAANSTTVNSGGYFYISSGGTASIVFNPWQGTIYSSGGAVVEYLDRDANIYFGSNGNCVSKTSDELIDYTITSGNSVIIYESGVANSTTVNSFGYLHVSCGGVANSTTVNSGGDLWISSGGTANRTTVNSFGYLHISSGGVANSTTVNRYGNLDISSGGTATDIAVLEGGRLGITVAPDTYIQGTSNGSAFEMKDATIDHYTVNFLGSMFISSGGVANSTTVNSRGSMFISSGGTASILFNPWQGTIYSSAGAVVEYLERDANIYFGSNGNYVNKTRDDLINHTITSGNSVIIYESGVANSTTVNSRGYLWISSGGVANSTIVNDWGDLWIFSGGTASIVFNPWQGNIVSSGGAVVEYLDRDANIYFGSNGNYVSKTSDELINHTITSGNSVIIYESGVANSTTVNSGGDLWISSGGTANSTTVNSGGYFYISSGGTATDIAVSEGGRLDITVAPDTYIQGSYNGSAFEMKDATINNYTVNSGGRIYISSGGAANSTTVNSGGRIYISSGGAANSTMVNSGGYFYILSGGTATDIIWTPCVGYVSAADCAYVTYVSQYSGVYFGSANQLLSSAATMDNKIVSGSMYVMSDGTANSTTVSRYGSMYISCGGVANNTTVNSFGYLRISSGGVANETVLSGGGYYAATMHISNGGVANYTTVNSRGSMTISSGGVANSTTVNSGGRMYISSGGVANSTIVNSGGAMYISSGGIMKGSLEIAAGGVVTVAEGGIIDFTVAKQESADTALINDLSRITDNGVVYTLTVAEDQVFGDYVLAGNAAAFDKTITVKTDSAELGTLTVGTNFVIDGVTFALNCVDGDLVFMYDDITPPTLDIVVNQKVSRDYEFVVGISEPAQLQYKIDNGEWQDVDGTTIAVTQNGTYSFQATDLAGNTSEVVTKEISGLSFANPEKTETTGSKTTWTPVTDEAGNAQVVVVQYSMDDFKSVVTIVTTESAFYLQSLPADAQWRVKGQNAVEWVSGGDVAATDADSPQVFESVEDGVVDIFFARTDGQWSLLYQATHHGIKGGWEGTQDAVSLDRKSKIVDVFSGAGDIDILYLTDKGNGDALFVDDIFDASFEGVAQTQSRIANLDEIHAGAGDDIIDMTSQRFNYIGDGVTIYGGDGNDTIWSNKGDNQLFGDAGNDNIIGASGNDVIVGGSGDDTMHGGGGDDIFTFGGDWGNDTVEQLDTGSITLWFEDGSEDNWNADTRTYTDGENTVTVSGVSADDITFKFGGDISSLPDGVFADSVTEKIFENSDTAMLA